MPSIRIVDEVAVAPPDVNGHPAVESPAMRDGGVAPASERVPEPASAAPATVAVRARNVADSPPVALPEERPSVRVLEPAPRAPGRLSSRIGTETWAQNGEKALNTTWPNEGTDPVERGKGGGGLVTKVVETEGSIGYANVADARANAAFDPSAEGGTGGPGRVSSGAKSKTPKTNTPTRRPTASTKRSATRTAAKLRTRTSKVRNRSRPRRRRKTGTASQLL